MTIVHDNEDDTTTIFNLTWEEVVIIRVALDDASLLESVSAELALDLANQISFYHSEFNKRSGLFLLKTLQQS